MYAYLKGTLISVHPTYVILDVQGIGYSLYIPSRLMHDLPPISHSVQFYTTFVVREFSHTLYAFLTVQERDLFELLMNVSGIGPKLALSLIGHLTFSELQIAIANQNFPILCRVPGVGKKTAERLVVELKDKLSSFIVIPHIDLPLNSSDQKGQMIQDATLALVNLGYHSSIAQKAIHQSIKLMPDIADLAQLITTALKHV